MSSPCDIAEVDLWVLAEEATESEASEELRSHVAACPICQGRLANMQRLCSSLKTIGKATPKLPDKIGPYNVLRLLGEGGMGFVYEAEQTEPRRNVAVKVLRPQSALDERFLRAFRREVRALARLEHPDIATIYDAGRTDDGQVYLAMRLVEGKPLDQYCEDQRLDLRARVALMARIARAVHHAHQRGILHQDLKPGNILVSSEGHPHILDFGLARPVQTDEGERPSLSISVSGHSVVGTLAFMSPEQARGDDDIDVRTDVYSLGVMLYRLATQRAPYEVSNRLEHAVRSITEAVPAHPSAKEKSIPRELGDVVMKAMAKDRGRRYDSAIGLAKDLEHYLAGEAVSARPASLAYQVRVFARRHKAAVASTAAVFMALVAGIIGIGLALARAERERAEAELVTTLMNEAIGIVDPFETPAEIPTALDSMNRLALRLETEELFAPDSLHEARLRATMGVAYHNIGEAERTRVVWAVAEPHLRKAFETRRRVLGDAHPDSLQSAYDLGLNLRRIRKNDEAEAVVNRAMEAWRASGEAGTLAIAAMLREQGTRQVSRGNLEEGERLFRQSERIAASFPPSNYRNVVWSWAWHQLGLLANTRNDRREGLRVSRKALEIRRELRPYHPHLYYSFAAGGLKSRLINVADAEHQAEGVALFQEQSAYLERLSGALDLNRAREAHEVWRWKGDPTDIPALLEELADHSVTASPPERHLEARARAQIATREALRAMGQFEDAADSNTQLARTVEELRRQKPRNADRRWNTIRDALRFAALWLPPANMVDELPSAVAEARPLFQEALAIQGGRPNRVFFWIVSLYGEDALAEDFARQRLEAYPAETGDELGPVQLTLRADLAEFQRMNGHAAAAEDLARDILDRAERQFGSHSGNTGSYMQTLGRILSDLEEYDEGEKLLRAALEIWREKAGEDHGLFALAQRDLGTLLQRHGQYSEAESELRDALGKLSMIYGPYHWETARARSELGACLDELDRLDEAREELDIAYRSFKHVLGDEHKWTMLAAERLASSRR